MKVASIHPLLLASNIALSPNQQVTTHTRTHTHTHTHTHTTDLWYIVISLRLLMVLLLALVSSHHILKNHENNQIYCLRKDSHLKEYDHRSYDDNKFS